MSLSPGAKATLVLWGAAIIWDLFCDKDQTISEAIERGLNNKRTEPLVTLAILATAAHLMRSLPPRYDLYSLGFGLMGRMVKRSHDH